MSSNVPRVYALGSTPVLKYLSLSLANYSKQPKPVSNIILLLKDNLKMNRFLHQESYLDLTMTSNSIDAENDTSTIRKQFMASCEPPKFANKHISPIENLIISEPTYFTFKEDIKKYSQCLVNGESPSNVLLINPGLDTINMYEEQWNRENYKANLFVGITQQNLIQKRQEFSTVKTDELALPLLIKMTQVKKVLDEDSSPDDEGFDRDISNDRIDQTVEQKEDTLVTGENYEELFLQYKTENALIDLIDGAALEQPELISTSRQSYEHFLIESLEKLCLETCIGAMSVIFDESNMNLLRNSDHLQNVWNKMTKEFSYFVNAFYPALNYAFSNERMNSLILQYLSENKKSTVPMQIELNLFKKHNSIHRANGLIIRMASFKNLSLPTNELIYNMIQSKISLMNP